MKCEDIEVGKTYWLKEAIDEYSAFSVLSEHEIPIIPRVALVIRINPIKDIVHVLSHAPQPPIPGIEPAVILQGVSPDTVEQEAKI